jgi:EAL domain-containing protein (putative c-di-GMP-specific phosphodiesterase class I)
VQVFKLGGDEFIVLLPTASRPEDAVRLAQAVREECARPFVVNANEVAVTASIGIAMFPHDGDGAIPLLKTAETAMYHAKKLGRNMYQMYRTALTTQLTQRLTIENDLRKALQRDEFEVYYQPQVGLSGADIIGMEALIRWNHPQRGLVSPGEFIPIAEETGLILPIGEWVLRTACRQAAAWREAGFDHLRVAVNLCSLQFGEPDFIAKVAAILDETGLPGTALELELTESLLMDHSDASIAKLSQLRDMDIHLSIDDFGTGYSSMNYLKSFPVGTIKIDRSFIRELPKDRDHAAITTAIIAMAHSLRMKVLAEGVETAEQAEFLSGYGCEGMQGYFYGRPMPAGDATALLREKEATAHRNPALRLARGR